MISNTNYSEIKSVHPRTLILLIFWSLKFTVYHIAKHSHEMGLFKSKSEIAEKYMVCDELQQKTKTVLMNLQIYSNVFCSTDVLL